MVVELHVGYMVVGGPCMHMHWVEMHTVDLNNHYTIVMFGH